jgi:hypothetical protein
MTGHCHAPTSCIRRCGWISHLRTTIGQDEIFPLSIEEKNNKCAGKSALFIRNRLKRGEL